MYIIDLQKREVTGSVHCRKERMEREDKAGIGYVDFIFYPETDKRADGIILELKVDHTAEWGVAGSYADWSQRSPMEN
jgi:hypothetical protein